MWGERGRGGNEPRGAVDQRDPVQRHFQEPNAVSGISYQAVMTRRDDMVAEYTHNISFLFLYIFPFGLINIIDSI